MLPSSVCGIEGLWFAESILGDSGVVLASELGAVSRAVHRETQGPAVGRPSQDMSALRLVSATSERYVHSAFQCRRRAAPGLGGSWAEPAVSSPAHYRPFLLLRYLLSCGSAGLCLASA